MSDDDRLDESTDELIAEQEQSENCQRQVPVRRNCDRQECGEGGAQECADVRNESHQTGEDAPQRSVRDAEKVKTESDQQTEAEVQESEGQEVAADAMRRLADRLGR